MTDGRVRRIVLGGNEFYILVSEAEIVEGFLNQVGILVATWRNSAVGTRTNKTLLLAWL